MKPKTWKPWDEAQTEIARRLIEEKATDDECQQALGRTKQACFDRLKRLGEYFGENKKHGFVNVMTMNVPQAVLEERNRRLMAPHRDLSGSFFNDPRIGFSALDIPRRSDTGIRRGV